MLNYVQLKTNVNIKSHYKNITVLFGDKCSRPWLHEPACFQHTHMVASMSDVLPYLAEEKIIDCDLITIIITPKVEWSVMIA